MRAGDKQHAVCNAILASLTHLLESLTHHIETPWNIL